MQDHVCFSDSLQKQSHNIHHFLTPCRSKVIPFFIFRLPAEAKSPSFEFIDMLTPCRSKVTFVLVLDPLQKQGLGHSLVFDSLQKAKVITLLIFWLPAEAKSYHSLFFDSLKKQSHHHLNSLTCWPPAEIRSHLSWYLIPCRSKVLAILWFLTPCKKAKVITLLIFWLPAEAKSYHSLFFDSLQKQSHHHLNLLTCWPPAEARSHLSWYLIPCRSKVLAILWFLTPCKSKSHNLTHSMTPCRNKVIHWHVDPLQK